METTLVLLKPDAVQRGLIGEIVNRLEKTGLKITGMKLMQVSQVLANQHYGEHVGKPFFEGLVSFITSGPIVALAVQGNGAVGIVRKTMGATNPAESPPGTVRGDFGIDIGRNLVHGSDSVESAAREVALFFDEADLVDYSRATDPWITE
ncbi:MAG: nucleoside-diphosphate kinase [Dehalococcoidia bacterium]|nr:nucleoside-diphosphate kinase [Dehalococcoidia bacterium]